MEKYRLPIVSTSCLLHCAHVTAHEKDKVGVLFEGNSGLQILSKELDSGDQDKNAWLSFAAVKRITLREGLY